MKLGKTGADGGSTECNTATDGSPSKIPALKTRNFRNHSGMTRVPRSTAFRLLLIGILVALAALARRAVELARQTSPRESQREEETILLSLFREDYLVKSQMSDKTLALLYPPGLLGGYRNQVLRFIAFCVHAKQQNISRILLPSLLWSTQLDGIGTHVEWLPIPFDWIFDTEHWNTFAPRHLPLLVNSGTVDESKSDCWMEASEREDLMLLQHTARSISNATIASNPHFYVFPLSMSTDLGIAADDIVVNHLQRAALLQGAVRPLVNITIPLLTGQFKPNMRRVDYAQLTQGCQNPFVYGGGTRAGRLWNDYISFQHAAGITGNETSVVPFETDVWVYRALTPSALWREVAATCVNQYATTGRYIALHARIELEIMGHPCGLLMEKNLTRILQRVYQLHDDLAGHPSGDGAQPSPVLSGLFIAVSRAGMADTRSSSYSRFQAYADENLRILDMLTSPSMQRKARRNEHLPLFECGERVLQEYYVSHPDVPDHGSLLQSVINFHIAVAADVFVGVEGSSYSTDVLTTRYWLGKGKENFRYTKSGIDRVENGGLPRPHSNCKRKKSTG